MVSSGLVTTETSETPISLSSCYPYCRPFAGALGLSDKDGMSPMHLIKPAQAGSPIPHCPQSDSYQLPSSLPCFSSGLLQILLLHGVWKPEPNTTPNLLLGTVFYHGTVAVTKTWGQTCLYLGNSRSPFTSQILCPTSEDALPKAHQAGAHGYL